MIININTTTIRNIVIINIVSKEWSTKFGGQYLHLRNVQSSGGDICGYQERRAACFELL